jgi:CRISPR-associated endonuclease/helicase Cas3/CRISPR-associated endonuclease Cas3-HD
MPDKIYYAHSREKSNKSDWQPLKTHLVNVAEIASEYGKDFNAGPIAYTSGLLHDLGKYSTDFQKRLEGNPRRVDHSTAGAIEALKTYQKAFGIVLAYVLTGHHGGLLNWGSIADGLKKRLNTDKLPDYSAYRKEIAIPDPKSHILSFRPLPGKRGFSISFFTRMLFSCLVDADSLDTERFMDPTKSSIRGNYESFDVLYKKFEDFILKKNSLAKDTPINRERRAIFGQCVSAGQLPPGFFTLTVPTGGGKTLSSMAFAFEHLKHHKLKRIFYVIPYTSIIEQNAQVFRKILGDRNVLEHHSNFDADRIEFDDMDTGAESLKLASENWDMPIVVTTNVQFFESLFSNRRSRCRKLHNLTKSVIILDEAQMLPTGYLLPCLAALSELVCNYGSTVVFCTATQPKLNDLLYRDFHPREIADSPDNLYETFRRVSITDLGSLDDKKLIDRLSVHRQVLCIVNTRKHAKVLFDVLRGSGNCYHLSARMCPVHRREKIAEIKQLLKEGKDCKVISTQLIEAGVDIDFPVVYRTMTGIDSIAQAAGRCNREGMLRNGVMFIFRSTESHGKATSWQNLTAEIGEMVLQGSDDPLSLKTVSRYFEKLYHYKEEGGLDEKKILTSIEERARELAFPFEEIAEAFRLIDEPTKDLIIPYDDHARLKIKELKSTEYPWRYIRDLQPYTVSIYPQEFQEMERAGVIDSIADRFYILTSGEHYSSDTGLKFGSTMSNGGSLLII